VSITVNNILWNGMCGKPDYSSVIFPFLLSCVENRMGYLQNLLDGVRVLHYSYYYAYRVILTWKKITCFQGCWLHILWNGLWTSIIPWFNSWGWIAANLPSTRLTTCRCMGWFSSTICITTVLTRSTVDQGSPPRCWCPRVIIKVPVCKFLVYWKSWKSQITSYNVGLRWTTWQ